jgi:hypothetical protein
VALVAIDDVLAWDGSTDSATWTARPGFPALSLAQRAVVAELCARTGLDGYAATLMVDDAASWGTASPWHGDVADAETARLARTCGWIVARELERAAASIAAGLSAFGAKPSRVFQDMARALAPVVAHMTRAGLPPDLAHEVDLIQRPGWHRHRCPQCHPAGFATPPNPAARGYSRRLRARRRRCR